MDTGEGMMKMIDYGEPMSEVRKHYPKSKGVFTIGEVLEIKGSKFKVKDISPFGIKLKVLPQD